MDSRHIEDLIHKEIEGTISESEAVELEALLKSDPKVHQQMAEALWIHGNLLNHSDDLPDLLKTPISKEGHLGIHKFFYIVTGIAAALCFIWMGSFINIKPENTKEIVATLVKAKNCSWGASELPTVPNSPLTAGQLNLIEGIAVIKFNNGAELVMEAPSNVELVSNMYLKLIGGSVVMDIPEQAIGFTVETNEGKVIDYGTKFGVTATELDKPQVWVFDGEVEIQSKSLNNKPQRLYEGQSVSFGNKPKITKGEASIGYVDNQHQEWITLIPSKDNYMRYESDPISQKSPLLMVKYSTLAIKNVRLSYITFDLSDQPIQKLLDAKFSLDLQPSGKGFAAQIPDCDFTVYGILDHEGDEWDEANLTTDNAPSFNKKTLKLDKSNLNSLGHFKIARGISSGTRSISTKSLIEFIKNNKNGKVTFIIERDNDELGNQGLVNAFASKENPLAAPPRLLLKF